MKIGYSDYLKKAGTAVLVSEAIFYELENQFPKSKIQQIAETSSGGTPDRGRPEYYYGDIPWLKSGELNDGFIYQSEEHVSPEAIKNSSAKIFPSETMLVAMYGATAGKVGITKVAAATNQAICAVIPKSEIDQRFLFWFFRSHRFKFIEISKGGAQPNISQKVIQNTQVPIPPMEIQRQVVEVLDSIENINVIEFEKIPAIFQESVHRVFSSKNSVSKISESITHQLSLVKQLRQAFLREAMQGKLVPQNPADEPASELLRKIKAEKEQLIKDKKLKKEKPLPPIKSEEIPFEIPENWVWCRLGEIAESRLGKMLDKTKNKGTPFPYLRNVNVQWYKINLSDLLQMRFQNSDLEEFSLRKGDLLICEGGYPGRSALWTLNESSIKFQKALHRVRFFGKVEPLLYLYYLDLICNNGFIRNYFTGSGIQHLTGKSLNIIPFPVPPLPEQVRIVQKLEQLMQLCDGLEQSITQSQQQNEMLLQQVLREALEPAAAKGEKETVEG